MGWGVNIPASANWKIHYRFTQRKIDFVRYQAQIYPSCVSCVCVRVCVCVCVCRRACVCLCACVRVDIFSWSANQSKSERKVVIGAFLFMKSNNKVIVRYSSLYPPISQYWAPPHPAWDQFPLFTSFKITTPLAGWAKLTPKTYCWNICLHSCYCPQDII